MPEDAVIQIAREKAKWEWQDGIPDKKAQEWLSLSCLQAIIAQAGLNIVNAQWDDGVDLLVGATKSLRGVLPMNHFIALQVKSTQTWTESAGGIRYFLRRGAWTKLRGHSGCKQFLVVFLLPQSRDKWFTAGCSIGLLRHCAFCLPAAALPATCHASGTTIDVPRTSMLTAKELIRHVYEAAPPGQTLGGAA